MGPPPEPEVRGTALVPAGAPAAEGVDPLAERKWTTVRRRELITRQQYDAAKEAEQPAPKSGRKGG
jgi:hypothetical protein